MNEEACLKFFKFIYDRHLIWHKRFVLKEPPPWSDNEVFNNTRFCNIYRELDKGTIYLKDKVLNNKNLDEKTQLFNIVLYRFFNLHGFFETHVPIIDPDKFNFKELEERFDKLQNEGKKLFSAAYLINSRAHPDKYRTNKKHIQVLLSLQDFAPKCQMFVTHFKNALCAKETFLSIKNTIRMVGPFLAYEIYCDLSYTKWFPYTEDQFVSVGPGAIWGLRLMFNKEKIDQKTGDKYCHELKEIQAEYWSALSYLTGERWEDIYYSGSAVTGPLLSLRGIEHSLCEYRKFLNISNPNKSAKRRNFLPTS